MTTKKLIAVATAFSLAVGGTSYVTPFADAATTLKLKNVSSKKTLYVGKKFTIKTNQPLSKLTFKSNKKSVATVNKKGTITAKKKGTCKITITAKISAKKTSKKSISLTVKKKTASVTATPKVTNTPVPTATAKATNTPAVPSDSPSSGNPTATAIPQTTAPATTTVAPTNTPETVTKAPTNTPTVTTNAPTGTPESTPTVPTETNSSTPNPTATQEAMETTKPTASPEETTSPATGTIFVSSITFTENGVSLQDANKETVAPSDASNVVVTDGTYITITAPTEGQEISISGTCSNGQIKVDVDKNTYPKGSVDLSLEGLTLSNKSTSPIYIASIDDICNISAKKNTENNISDGTSYTNEDESNGAIYSKDDLKLKGKGTLNVTGNCGFGIISKNDLKIFNGTIQVTAKGVAIKGKDSVKFGDKDDLGKEGAYDDLKVTLTSETSDGVRSTNPKDDETKVSEDKDYGDGKTGEIIINGGTIKVTSYGDAFQSAGDVTVNGGTVDLYTYQGSNYSPSKNENNSWGSFPGRPGTTSAPSTTTDDISAKGLKAAGNLTINDGTITIDSSDDALHCAGSAVIKNGKLTLATGDDGIHADTDIVIDGGNINLTKSYEGIEAPTITVNDGTVHIVSSDDGFNASDGSGEAAGGFGGGGFGGPNGGQMWGGNTNTSTSTTTCELYIKGGYCLVDAEGDGLDSNGNLHISGGTTLVVGPSRGGNGSFDYGDGGSYTFEYTGGTVMAVGTSDMAVFPTNTSDYLTRSLSASGENTIAVTDKDGQVLSVLKFNKSAQLLTYCNSDTTVSDCKVYLNPEYDKDFDKFGYSSGGSISGGTELNTTASNPSTGGGGRPGRFSN